MNTRLPEKKTELGVVNKDEDLINYDIQFDDVVEIQKQHPDTFQIPSDEEREKVKVGQHIKVISKAERLWTEVIDIIKDDQGIKQYVCIVDNFLVLNEAINYGSIVPVMPWNIMDIQTIENDERMAIH
jgi:hypothetical protein